MIINIVKKGLLFITIILLFSVNLSSIVQGDVIFDDYKRDIVSDSSDSTTIHFFCGKIYNLTKWEFQNSTLCLFNSTNMRILGFEKGSGGTWWWIWYIRYMSEVEYLIECSHFRGILTQKFIFGYTLEDYEY